MLIQIMDQELTTHLNSLINQLQVVKLLEFEEKLILKRHQVLVIIKLGAQILRQEHNQSLMILVIVLRLSISELV